MNNHLQPMGNRSNSPRSAPRTRTRRMGVDITAPFDCATTWPGYDFDASSGGDTVETFPGAGRANIPPAEHAEEWPFVPQQFVGIPASATTGPYLYVFADGPWVSWDDPPIVEAASLTGPAGAVEVRTVDRDTNQLGDYLPPGAGMLIPVTPLRAQSAYTAAVNDGQRQRLRHVPMDVPNSRPRELSRRSDFPRIPKHSRHLLSLHCFKPANHRQRPGPSHGPTTHAVHDARSYPLHAPRLQPPRPLPVLSRQRRRLLRLHERVPLPLRQPLSGCRPRQVTRSRRSSARDRPPLPPAMVGWRDRRKCFGSWKRRPADDSA